jgi:hypothetical protein
MPKRLCYTHDTHKLDLELNLTQTVKHVLRVLKGLLQQVYLLSLNTVVRFQQIIFVLQHLLLDHTLETCQERLKLMGLLDT